MSFSQKDILRFYSRVQVRGTNDCWLWQGRKDKDGYGRFFAAKKHMGAHRFAFLLKNIQAPVIRHSCDNKACCNPLHLLPGTHADNVRDKVERGRQVRGSAIRQSKLSEAEVLAIRSDPRSNSLIARDFGVHPASIRDIKSRRCWKHV